MQNIETIQFLEWTVPLIRPNQLADSSSDFSDHLDTIRDGCRNWHQIGSSCRYTLYIVQPQGQPKWTQNTNTATGYNSPIGIRSGKAERLGWLVNNRIKQ